MVPGYYEAGGELAAWFVLDPVVPDSNKTMSTTTKKGASEQEQKEMVIKQHIQINIVLESLNAWRDICKNLPIRLLESYLHGEAGD